LTAAIDDLEVEPLLEPDVAFGAYLAQEGERLVITPEQGVLAVVDDFAGLRIRKRARARFSPRPQR